MMAAKSKTGWSGWSRELRRPLYSETGADSAFWFSVDAEALFAAEGILGASPFSLYRAVYGGEHTERLLQKYRIAREIRASFIEESITPCMFECLQGFDVREFSLSSYRDHVMSIDKKALPGILLDTPADSLDDLVGRERELFNSYLGASAYFSNAQDYAGAIFEMAEQLKTNAFYSTLDRYGRKIEEAQKNAIEALAVSTPLEYSDYLLRKNMWRRGPYSFFAFAPTVFSWYRGVRFIGSEQFLFYAVQDAVYDNEHMLRQLKALADDTRFRIVALLKERGGLQGSDIAHITGLSASTVSHHMRILREAGLMHEEADGATKFYSLPTNMAKEVSEALSKFLP